MEGFDGPAPPRRSRAGGAGATSGFDPNRRRFGASTAEGAAGLAGVWATGGAATGATTGATAATGAGAGAGAGAGGGACTAGGECAGGVRAGGEAAEGGSWGLAGSTFQWLQ
ncbi:MAG: hypothetical protein EPO40_02015 [Myxococcaceae bacterium]|nr:MAG: hypothetical protein EPO40_02015 [Myxococcaceae bacterium]